MLVENHGIVLAQDLRVDAPLMMTATGYFTSAAGSLSVTDSGFVSARQIGVGLQGEGELNLTGSGKIQTQNLMMGQGGMIRTSATAAPTLIAGSGVVNVSGNASLTAMNINMGVGGNATMNISQNGSVQVESAQIGRAYFAVSSMSIMDEDGIYTIVSSTMLASGSGLLSLSGNARYSAMNTNIGLGGEGELRVTDNARADSRMIMLGDFIRTGSESYFGNPVARLTVSGNGYVFADTLMVGRSGTGILTISDNGMVNTSVLNLAQMEGSYAEVNLNGGMLNAGRVVRGLGEAALTITGGTLRTRLEDSNLGGLVDFDGAAINLDGVFSTITLSTPEAVVDTVDQDLTVSGFNGLGGLVKEGVKALIISGTSTHGGVTKIAGGVLQVINSGALAATEKVQIEDGNFRYDGAAQLDRDVEMDGGKFSHNSAENFAGQLIFNSGTLGGTNLKGLGQILFNAGKALAPGNSIGTEELDAAEFAGGALELEIGGAADHDKLSVGTLTLGAGGIVINLVNYGFDDFNASENYTWEFVTYDTLAGTLTVSYDNSRFAALDTAQLSVLDTGNALLLNYTAIPEPSAWLLILSGISALTLITRRRR